MRDKRYEILLPEGVVEVIAEAEGQARYMVRARAGRLATFIRIGYLTGCGRNWLAEYFGNRPSLPTSSAKQACAALAQWAVTQPGCLLIQPAAGSPA